jgi:hypothetical protein
MHPLYYIPVLPIANNSRELKLSAIEWFLNTYVKGKEDRDLNILITKYAAAQRLGITSTMLKS